MEPLLPYRGIRPQLSPRVFIAPGATIIGDVAIGAETSIWFGCVIRGDVNVVRIGERTLSLTPVASNCTAEASG